LIAGKETDLKAKELISGRTGLRLYALVGFVIVFYFVGKGKQKNIAGG
jgi:hypothetical protein